MHIEGELEGYLGGVHRAAQHFDAFYDFAHPSAFTFHPAWSWDGSHPAPDVSDRIAATLLGRNGAPALRVDELAIGDYRRRYRESIDAIIASIDALAASQSTAP